MLVWTLFRFKQAYEVFAVKLHVPRVLLEVAKNKERENSSI